MSDRIKGNACILNIDVDDYNFYWLIFQKLRINNLLFNFRSLCSTLPVWTVVCY